MDRYECMKLWNAAIKQVADAWNDRWGNWLDEDKPWCNKAEENTLTRRVGHAIAAGDLERTKERIEEWKHHWRKCWKETAKCAGKS